MRLLQDVYRQYKCLEGNAAYSTAFVTELILEKFHGRWRRTGTLASQRVAVSGKWDIYVPLVTKGS
jgi:hypothetical protein